MKKVALFVAVALVTVSYSFVIRAPANSESESYHDRITKVAESWVKDLFSASHSTVRCRNIVGEKSVSCRMTILENETVYSVLAVCDLKECKPMQIEETFLEEEL
jgi:hypothetical protein